jgi:NitT/TauT family transport system permease protein
VRRAAGNLERLGVGFVAKTMSKKLRERASNVTQLFLFALSALVLWQLAVRILQIPRYLLPSPSSVFVFIFEHPVYLAYHSWITLLETILGFLGGAVLGIAGGTGIFYSAWLRKTLYPVLIAFNTIPKVALAPLFLVWFGYGLLPKVLIALLIAFFPIVVNTVDGLSSVPLEMIELATIFRASEWHKFWKVAFIHSLPNIFTGFKVSMATAVGGAVVAEFIGSSTGLGYIIVMANTSVNLASMFSAFVLLSVIALGLFALVEQVQKLVIPWSGM